MTSMDQVAEWEALLQMWMRRVSDHSMLGVIVMGFMTDLARLDKEMRKTDPDRKPFEEDMDDWLAAREEAIRHGRVR